MNKALLAKMAWRVIIEEDAIWAKVIRSKYGLESDGLVVFKEKQRSLLIWKGLVWCAELLQRGLKWQVANGKRVRFWVDEWLE